MCFYSSELIHFDSAVIASGSYMHRTYGTYVLIYSDGQQNQNVIL